MKSSATAARRAVPRGIDRNGPAVLSYGFRPFFLAAGLYAFMAMALWLLAIGGAIAIGGTVGAPIWHAHEMLFGYASAALAGFLLTAIPNWTGRLPVSGLPLLALFGLWGAGRVAMAAPDVLGTLSSALVDSLFLPVLAAVAAREVIAGRNWRNLKMLIGLGALSGANVAFHILAATDGDIALASRGAVAVYILLIAVIGGRIVPSFTRNFIVKAGGIRLPRSFDRLDMWSVIGLAVALATWVAIPEHPTTAVAAAVAAVLHTIRLSRWEGRQTFDEPMLAMLHAGYAFVPLGLAAVAAAALGWISAPSALHVLTVGGIGGMTLAVMTRASLGHTGRRSAASTTTAVAYLALLFAAVGRPFAELLPDHFHVVLIASGGAWLLAFALFTVEYAPILWTRRSQSV